MSPKGTLFFDEWQACLRAHYLYVLRSGDRVTEPTLRRVLRHSGLTEADIAALHYEAEVELAPPEEAETPAPASVDEFEDADALLDDDDLLCGDDSGDLEDLPPTGEPDLPDDLPPDDAPPLPDGPPPPSQLSLF